MKEINGNIDILVDNKGAFIEIRDVNSRQTICQLRMSAEDFCSALGRLVHIPCIIKLGDTDKLGKIRITEPLIFEIPDKYRYAKKDTIREMIKEKTPEGWEPDLYLGSKDNFFTRDKKEYVRTSMYKWTNETGETNE